MQIKNADPIKTIKGIPSIVISSSGEVENKPDHFDAHFSYISGILVKRCLNEFGIYSKCLVLKSPFSTNFYSWIQKTIIPKSLNGVVRINHQSHRFDAEMAMYLLKPEKRGVYFLKYGSPYMSDEYLVFSDFDTRDPCWTEESITEFLRELSMKFFKYEKENIDPERTKAIDSIFLPENIVTDIKMDIESFLESKKLYKEDLSLPWKRGYFFYGPPGNGKTLLIKKLCQYYNLHYTDLQKCISQDGSLNLNPCSSFLENQLSNNCGKPEVFVLEDLDKLVTFQGGSSKDVDAGSISLHNLLKGMDGVDEIDGAIFMATTNFPDMIHDALTCRPGRFDRIFGIEKPTAENIKKLLQHYKINIIDKNLSSIANMMFKEKLSMAFVTEFVKIVKTQERSNDISFSKAETIFDKIKKHQASYHKQFKKEQNGCTMGFLTTPTA